MPRKSPLVYYFDSNMEHRCPVNEEGEPIIDWGIMTPGSKKELTLYVQNTKKDKLAIRQPYTNDEDLHITDFPTRLMGNDSGKVKLTFTPNSERLETTPGIWGFEDIVIG